MRGFFKHIIIRNEIRYGIEVSLEGVQQLCTVPCPLHTSSASCDGSFFVRPAGLLRVTLDPRKHVQV